MTNVNLAILPGDGIGPEVVDAAMKVLEVVAKQYDVRFETETLDVGGARYARSGVVYTEEDFRTCRSADAILLGALGLPDALLPDGTEAGPSLQFRLRFDLDLYAGIRPIVRYPSIPGPLRTEQPFAITTMRENTEGLYASRNGGSVVRDSVVTDTMVVTEAGIDRIVEAAFDWALSHPRPDGSVHVTCVDKANVLRSYAFFRRRFDTVAARYQGRATWDHIYVDAYVAQVVLNPQQFHVVVAENMFADIISDLTGGLVGSLGLAPSGDVGREHAVFQPAHGSAPTLAGRGVANPVATILSAAMMCDWLADRKKDPRLTSMARDIEQGVRSALASPDSHTADLGGRASTAQCAGAIIAALPDWR